MAIKGRSYNPKSCFLALSYTSGDSPSRIEQILTSYFVNKGFQVRTGREIPAGEKIDEGIRRIIEECGFGVVVYNELRHNISYEWGILDALKKPVVPLRDRNAHIDLDRELSDKKGTVIPSYSGDSEAREILGELEKDPSFSKAIDKIEQDIAERISPEEPKQAEKAARLIAESSLPLGGIEEAREVPNASEIAKALEAVRELTAEGHFYRASAYYYANRPADAEAQLREALRLNPNLAEAHNNLGLLLKKLGRDGEAEAEYREALRLNPSFAVAHSNLGALLLKLDRDEEAEAECREALRLNPSLAEAHCNLGLLLARLDGNKEAEAEYREALRLNPNLAEAHNSLGVLLEKVNKDKEAEAEYREALRLNPNLAEAHCNLGLLLEKLDRGEEAKRELKTGIGLFEKQGSAANARRAKEILNDLVRSDHSQSLQD